MIYGVIHTPTLEDYIDVVGYAHDNGKTWTSGDFNKHYWTNYYRENTCVRIGQEGLLYGSKRYFEHNNIEILSIDSFYNKTNMNLIKLLKGFK